MKFYQCICGKTFTDPQKFNGHKQGCKIHIIAKYGSLEAYYLIKNRSKQKGAETRKNSLRKIKETLLQQWILEKHTCEKCGKVMTEKYGSGRFCSRSCANSRVKSDQSRIKVSKTLKKTYNHKQIKNNNILKYYQNPKRCCICGKVLQYDKRIYKTCSKDCKNKLQSYTMSTKTRQGIQHTNVRGRYKFGTYKGIFCDSSWELAFVLYLLDHNIDFRRNTSESFQYVYEGKTHNFFPDFIIDGVYYEIKNYRSALTDAKVACFPKNLQLIVLYYSEVKQYLAYAISKYGKNFFHLYDEDKPSWLNYKKHK